MKALNDKTQGKRGRISETRSLVAPIKGWWVGSPLAEAPPNTAYLLETGRVVMSGLSAAIRDDESVRRSYLGY